MQRENQEIHLRFPDGREVRTVTVPKPSDEVSPLYFAVDNGRIAIAFAVSDVVDFANDKFRLADSRTGKVVVDYQLGPETGDAVACYTNGRVSFLSLIPDEQRIIQAEVR